MVLAGIFSCGNEDDITKGTIEGYYKCIDPENRELVFGLFIVTEKNDSLLAYNTPHETLNTLLGLDIDELAGGSLYFSQRVPSVTFDYRKAKEDEIVNVNCLHDPMLFGFKLDGFEQVIISNINIK
jgi:hypothetical protein